MVIEEMFEHVEKIYTQNIVGTNLILEQYFIFGFQAVEIPLRKRTNQPLNAKEKKKLVFWLLESKEIFGGNLPNEMNMYQIL